MSGLGISGLWTSIVENEKKTFSHGVYVKAYTSGVGDIWRVYADCSFFFLMFRNVFRTETLSGFRWRQEWSGWRWKWWKLKLDLKNFSCMLFLIFLANLRFWVLGLYCNYLMWPQENSMTALTFLVPTLFPQSHVHLILQGHWIEK